MFKKLVIFALTSSFISCASPAIYQSFDGIKHPPSKKVDIYSTDIPTREYSEIGIIYIKGRILEIESSIKRALKKAKEIGADGLIFLKEDFENGYVTVSIRANWILKETQNILTFIAIKYRH